MYFQGDLSRMFCYLGEDTVNDIVQKAKQEGKAILYYNSALNVLNVATSEDCIKLSEINPIAIITEDDLKFANTNREEINKMSNDEFASFYINNSDMVDKVCDNQELLSEYLGQESEISTYNLAKIENLGADVKGLLLYTSEVKSGVINVGDQIAIAPINGKSYTAVVENIVPAYNKSGMVNIISRFNSDIINTPVSIIPKLIGRGLKLAPEFFDVI